ncbi:MAG: pyridoxamine 5'-phosphate oxidase family protein [Euryarchaeota archaeon]|nr:pyridoxamine 5'-phosphate oxidase family protein [Euryarchaeota archaeon]
METGEEILNFFSNSCEAGKPLVWIATTYRGEPHVVPVCFVKPVGSDKVLIANNFVAKTVKNILRGSKVALGAVKFADGYVGYMLKGRAEVLESGELFESIKRLVEEKTKGKRKPVSAILVHIEKIYSLKPGVERKRIS